MVQNNFFRLILNQMFHIIENVFKQLIFLDIQNRAKKKTGWTILFLK